MRLIINLVYGVLLLVGLTIIGVLAAIQLGFEAVDALVETLLEDEQ